MNFTPFNQMDLISVMWNSFDAFIYLNFTLTSPLTHYINCSTLFSAIILRVLIILLVKHIHILIVIIFIIIVTIVVAIILNLFIYFIQHLFSYLFHFPIIYLFIFFINMWTYSTRTESVFRFFNPAILRVEGVS